MALEYIGGSISTFGRGLDQIVGARLFFIPPTPGFVPGDSEVEDAFMSDKPIPADMAGDGSGRFTVGLEPVTNIRPPTDKQGRPWAYGVRIEIPAPDVYGNSGGYIHLDIPDFRVYVPVGGGTLRSMIDAPIRSGEVWVTTPGVIPVGAVAGDLIFNYVENHLGRIA